MTRDRAETAPDSLRERLEWLMLFRLVLVTFLLGSAVLVNVNDVESFNDPSYVAIVSLIVSTYVATLGYVLWIRRGWSSERLVFAQLIGDVALATGLVLLTGGIHSIFTFLFFLTIFNGAVLMGRRGAMFAASGSSLGLAAIVILQFGEFAFMGTVLPESLLRTERVPVYPLIIHLVGFFTVAALSGYLSEKLGQVGTELERRQLDIKELRALNENIVRSLNSGLVTLDLDERVIFFNDAAADITGYRFVDVNLQPIRDAIPTLAPLMDAAPVLLQGPIRPRVELRVERPDGTLAYLGVSLTALRDAHGKRSGTILIMQDITSVKSLEDKLLRQEHLSAIGKLSAAIAHEIRNPLASISGSIEMLRMMLDPPDEERQLMDIVIREVDRLNGLIEEFLDYARPERYRRSDVALGELVDETLRMFRQDPRIVEDVTLEVDASLSAGERLVHVDAGRLQQVVWNLLRNAADALNGPGTIWVRGGVSRSRRTGQVQALLIIEDNGPGLPDEVLPNLFEPFFTTKEGGTGLGLATCHRIVSGHGGTMDAENRPEGGARFIVRLPCLPSEGDAGEDGLMPLDGEALLPEGIFTERMDTADLNRVGPNAGRMVMR